MGKKIEMIGKRFGRNLVIAEHPERSSNGECRYVCECDCGKTHIVSGATLRKGESLSCGCYNHDLITKDDPKYKRKLYGVYHSVIDRCKNKNNKSYHNYGGRGIQISEEWNTYEKFEKWAYENGYQEGAWLEREDNDGYYSPDNCRWATPKEQQNNKRTNIKLTIDGQTLTLTQWAEKHNIKPATLQRRIELGWDKKDWFRPIDDRYSHGDAIRDSKVNDTSTIRKQIYKAVFN